MGLTTALRNIRQTRSKALVLRYANGMRQQIIVGQKFNRQNVRAYAQSSMEAAEKIG